MGDKIVEKSLDNLKKCICRKCPSYTLECKIKEMPHNLWELAVHHSDLNKIDHFEGMYCAFGKSECIHEPKGCICKECELAKQYELTEEYFCTK